MEIYYYSLEGYSDAYAGRTSVKVISQDVLNVFLVLLDEFLNLEVIDRFSYYNLLWILRNLLYSLFFSNIMYF